MSAPRRGRSGSRDTGSAQEKRQLEENNGGGDDAAPEGDGPRPGQPLRRGERPQEGQDDRAAEHCVQAQARARADN